MHQAGILSEHLQENQGEFQLHHSRRQFRRIRSILRERKHLYLQLWQLRRLLTALCQGAHVE